MMALVRLSHFAVLGALGCMAERPRSDDDLRADSSAAERPTGDSGGSAAPGDAPMGADGFADPSDPYTPPADRIVPSVARGAGLDAMRALGEQRSGVDGVGRVPRTSNTKYVSARDGADGNDGSSGAPWRSLQHAVDSVSPDTTILVDDSGEYGPVRITRSGATGRWIVLRNRDAGRAPRIRGQGGEAIVDIDASYVVFHGFEVTDEGGTGDPIGIRISPRGGDIEQIQISNNWVHHIGPEGLSSSSCSYNTHGILAQAEGHLLSSLYVVGNELEQLYVGNSECLVLNGNLDGFRVAGNYVHDVNNIGIDIIGYEVNAGETTRNGLVADNVVHDASNNWPYCTRGNCTYPPGDNSSNGIYVDGGASMVIEYNWVGRTDLGIELQSENGQLIRDVEVRFNVVFNSNYTNWVLGPNENCAEHDNEFFEDASLGTATC